MNFQASPGKKDCEIPSQWKKTELDDMRMSSQLWWEVLIGGLWSTLIWVKKETLSPK
jgi:hypothetical protein